jgi:hypothetical protein
MLVYVSHTIIKIGIIQNNFIINKEFHEQVTYMIININDSYSNNT